jgi:hypothetical protein
MSQLRSTEVAIIEKKEETSEFLPETDVPKADSNSVYNSISSRDIPIKSESERDLNEISHHFKTSISLGKSVSPKLGLSIPQHDSCNFVAEEQSVARTKPQLRSNASPSSASTTFLKDAALPRANASPGSAPTTFPKEAALPRANASPGSAPTTFPKESPEESANNSSKIRIINTECKKALGNSDNVVMAALLNCTDINLMGVIHFVPIVKLWGQCGPISISTASKIPFPYYGIPNAIVSIRYKTESRGIRKNTKYMKGVVSIDLQTCEKNIHINLSKGKMHITGAKNRNMGAIAFSVLAAHLNMAQQNLVYFRSLRPEVVLTTKKYILDTVQKTLFARNQIIEMTWKSTGKTIILDQPAYNLNDIKRQAPNDFDEQFATFLICHATEFTEYPLFAQRVEDILSTKSICETHIEIKSISICNNVFNYVSSCFNPEFQSSKVSFIKLSKFFLKNKFSVQYHNWRSTGLKVSIPLETMDTSSIKKKAKAHRFEFTKKDSVRQNSPTDYAEANIAFNMVCDYIEIFLATENNLDIFGTGAEHPITLDSQDRQFA